KALEEFALVAADVEDPGPRRDPWPHHAGAPILQHSVEKTHPVSANKVKRSVYDRRSGSGAMLLRPCMPNRETGSPQRGRESMAARLVLQRASYSLVAWLLAKDSMLKKKLP